MSEIDLIKIHDDALVTLDVIERFEKTLGMDITLEHSWAKNGTPFSRAVIVLGPARGGTSAVAGVLHHAGVRMRGKTCLAGPANPAGTFEDDEFLAIALGRPDPKELLLVSALQYAQAIRGRNGTLPLWGVKEPRLVFILAELMPLFEDPRFVVVERSYAATKASYEQWKVEVDTPSLEDQIDAIADFLDTNPGPLHFVDYDDLVDNPALEATKLIQFAYGGLQIKPAAWSMLRAIRSIDPEKRHHT